MDSFVQEESMDAFVQPETLEGTNQYFCAKCNKKCNAHKVLDLRIKSMIHVVHVHPQT